MLTLIFLRRALAPVDFDNKKQSNGGHLSVLCIG